MSSDKTKYMNYKLWNGISEELPKVINSNLEDIDLELFERGLNVKSIGAKGDGVTDDTSSIEKALNLLYQYGGGKLIFPPGIYLVSKKLTFRDRNIIIQGSGHATVIKAITPMDRVIDYSGTNQFGHRGGGIMNVKIDANNFADYGIVIGYETGTVTGEYFHHIRIENAKKWGMVWDTCQNNYFTLIDIEYCGGGLLMLNGAGNNKVDKSEFASIRKFHHVMSASNSNFPGYGHNDFANIPQANKFYSCVLERGEGLSSVYIETGKHNQFIDCEFSSTNMSVSAVHIDSNAALSFFTRCRFAGGFTKQPAIINHGYRTYVTDCYFENYTEDEILVSNRTIMGDCGSNHTSKLPRVKNISGDSALNILFSAAPRYMGNSSVPNEPKVSEFFHNDQNHLFFQSKSKLQQFITGKNFEMQFETTTKNVEHLVTVPLTNEGSWIVEILVANGDYNHTRSAIYIVRYRDRGQPAYNLTNVQRLVSDVTSGNVISQLDATVNVTGNLSISIITSLSTSLLVHVKAVCQMEY